ncbi:hypothetical protein ACJ8PQ_09245, partial [Serratia sp. CY74664]|uniref:hypothetical protein n=1 Tax=Serratia sp. CY74664 TaxID=3383676 RepID=UPI003FA0CED9
DVSNHCVFHFTDAASFKVNSGQIYLQRIISCLYSPMDSLGLPRLKRVVVAKVKYTNNNP